MSLNDNILITCKIDDNDKNNKSKLIMQDFFGNVVLVSRLHIISLYFIIFQYVSLTIVS